MRTSPQAMRLSRRACACAAALALTLVVSAAACGDDGDDGTSPTTTAPTTTAPDADAAGADDTTTTTSGTTEASATTGGGDTTEPGDATLTAAEAEGELARLFELYRTALQGAKARGALDEEFRAGLAEVMTPALLDTEIGQLSGIDVPARLPDQVPAVTVTEVEVAGGDEACAWGSARMDFTPFYGEAAPGPQTYFFRLAVRGDAGWRIDSLGFTESGEPYTGLECQG